MFSDLGLSVRGHHPANWSTSRERVALYVIHWPEAIFWEKVSKERTWYWIVRIVFNLALLKVRGTRVLWFVHNLEPHDLPTQYARAWKFYSGALSRLTDGWITLSPSTGNPVAKRYPVLADKCHTHVWHPPYESEFSGSRSEARAELLLPRETLVFGHAGALRRYKNLVSFAAQFETIAPCDAMLLLAGNPEEEIDSELKVLSERVSSLDYRCGAMSAREFDRVLNALDVFVAPYDSFLHSGALVHALSRGCVVVAPNAAFTADLKCAVGNDWVLLYDDGINSSVLRQAAEAAEKTRGAQPNMSVMMPSANEARMKSLLSEMGVELPLVDAADKPTSN